MSTHPHTDKILKGMSLLWFNEWLAYLNVIELSRPMRLCPIWLLYSLDTVRHCVSSHSWFLEHTGLSMLKHTELFPAFCIPFLHFCIALPHSPLRPQLRYYLLEVPTDHCLNSSLLLLFLRTRQVLPSKCLLWSVKALITKDVCFLLFLCYVSSSMREIMPVT